jgi:predicted HAD superfamily Cof-like phosphohydrolase
MQYKIAEVFDEIQRSNMSKLGEDGHPIFREDGKVLKGPNYFKPNISSILKK